MSPAAPDALRNAIAEVLWANVKDYALAGACDRLGMPDGAGSPPPYNSKRVYVRWRLESVAVADLREIARRTAEEYGDEDLADAAGREDVRGVDGEPRNLIFAALGPKPRIVLRDAIDNVIEIVEGADRVLTVDRPPPDGLSWAALVEWWAAQGGGDGAEGLYRRLRESLASPPEEVLFRAYGARYRNDDAPALLPQVYLHYDPYTRRELGVEGQELNRQRMDFLLLPSPRRRIVVEVDGKQHYSDAEGRASPSRYAGMAAEDRRLRLAGYEIYRFGAWELLQDSGPQTVARFFDELLP